MVGYSDTTLSNQLEQRGFKVLYFTHDINNKHKCMYQHKRFGAAITPLQKEIEGMWHSGWYRALKTDDRYLFQVDERSDLLQYIYYWTLENGFVWNPVSNVVRRTL